MGQKVTNSMNAMFHEFIDEISLSLSYHTILAYKYDIARFIDYLTERNIKRIRSIKPAQVTEYLKRESDRGKGDNTLFRYHMSLKAWFGWLEKRNLAENIMRDLLSPRVKKKPRKVPTQKQMMKLLDTPNVVTTVGLRDKAIMEVIYSSGLRAAETCDLGIEDYANAQLVIGSGKGNRTRSIPLNGEAVKWLDLYLNVRGREPGYLFVTNTGCRLTTSGLSKSIGRYAEKAQLNGITTHTLRHACATHLLEEGADMRLIQEILGHQSIATTQIYAHMTSKNLSEKFHKFQPRRQKDVN